MFKKTNVDKIKELKHKTEKLDQENILKSLKIDNDYHRKKHKRLNKKKVFIFNTEILIGSGLAITTSTLSIINPSIGLVLKNSTALLTSITILITIERISNIKIRYNRLRTWINGITFLYEKSLKTSMIDKRIDKKEALEMKKIYYLSIDKIRKV